MLQRGHLEDILREGTPSLTNHIKLHSFPEGCSEFYDFHLRWSLLMFSTLNAQDRRLDPALRPLAIPALAFAAIIGRAL